MKEKIYKVLIIILIILTIPLTGCTENIKNISYTVDDTFEEFNKIINELKELIPEPYINEKEISSSIANLEPIDDKTVSSYFHIGDSLEYLFTLLNREGGYNFQLPQGAEDYRKISKLVTEWTPLVNNYNEVIYKARTFNESDPDSVFEFRKAVTLLGLEFSIIYATVWFKPSYRIVGEVYRWSGLNRFAFSHPTSISFILRNAHWGLRTAMVEKSTDVIDYFISGVKDLNKFILK